MSGHDIGSRVRHAREQRGWSLSDVARLTKLPPSVLLAIERNDFDSLPAGMYRKAYLRTVAAEVGLDPADLAAVYDQMHVRAIEPAPPVVAASDRWIEELVPSRRRAAGTLAALAVLSAGWFALYPRAVGKRPATDGSGVESESAAMQTAGGAPRTLVRPNPPSESVRVANAVASHDTPLKIDLTTTGWCWVAVESDGERVVYALVEPGRRIVVDGHRRISLRLGDAGSVRLSINNGPPHTPGAGGEVVELEVTPGGNQATGEDLETES